MNNHDSIFEKNNFLAAANCLQILAARGREVRASSLKFQQVDQPETVGPGGGAIPDSNKNEGDL